MRRFLVRLLAVSTIAAVALSAAMLVLAPQASAFFNAGRSDSSEVDLEALDTRSVVYARDGSVLAVLHAEVNRAPVPLDEIPAHVIRVILAVEDENFYEHKGVNLRATGRALVSNVSAGEVVQGGSTITQQVIKNSLLTPERNLDRKLREAALAMRLEREMAKDEILERYLNTVYFGNGAYGVLAAAETYYGVTVQELTVGQAVTLASVIRNPVGHDPIRYPGVAAQRRSLVVDRLVRVGYLDKEEGERIKVEPLPDERRVVLPPPDDYFVEAVKQSLLDDQRLGETPTDRFNAVFRGGLRIFTTLDPVHQSHAEAAVADILPDTDGEFTAALVGVEPSSGAVRSLVGGPGFERAKFNLATQGRRQPGSSFKPFVLAAALAEGYSPRDTINGSGPCRFGKGVTEWKVQNYGNSGGSTTTLEWQTARSVNCAYARLVQIVGPEKVVDLVHDLGIKGEIEPLPALSLGSEEVTPLEMAAAYATFANDGLYKEPYFVERVEDRTGSVLYTGEHEGKQVLEENVARLMVDTLETVVTSGTATRARIRGVDAAGKTGTAQDHGNAWFVGFTPDISTAVWMGSPVGNVPMRNVGGVRVTGGSYPARIWQAYVSQVADPDLEFESPNWREVRRSKYLRLPGERYVAPRRSTVRRTPVAAPPPTAAPAPGGGGAPPTTSGDGGTDPGGGGTPPTTSGGGGGDPGGGGGAPPTTSGGGGGGGGGGAPPTTTGGGGE